MSFLRTFLAIATLAIFGVSIYVIATCGFNWPAIFWEDISLFDWHLQFDTDLLIFLLLFAFWIIWREGFGLNGFLLGFMSLFSGFLFSAPYLLIATYRAKGNAKLLLLGVHHEN